jgi:hypothetical protein
MRFSSSDNHHHSRISDPSKEIATKMFFIKTQRALIALAGLPCPLAHPYRLVNNG